MRKSNWGGNFCKVLLQISFLKSKYSLRLNHYLAVVLVLLLLVAGKAAALPEGKFIKVTKDTAICWADSDGCFNYILQANEARTANVLCKATGKKLRAGGTYFHTPYDITKDPAAAANEEFAQLVVKEKSSLEAFIDIQLQDNKGRQRSLTDLKGQVVLLDFHVFATDDSPARILLLRELYNKYHAQGLEIYQVSLDPDEHFWKQQTAALPWISVREPAGPQSQTLAVYNVQGMPSFFLIDRGNNIVGRSETINDLEQAIKALL